MTLHTLNNIKPFGWIITWSYMTRHIIYFSILRISEVNYLNVIEVNYIFQYIVYRYFSVKFISKYSKVRLETPNILHKNAFLLLVIEEWHECNVIFTRWFESSPNFVYSIKWRSDLKTRQQDFKCWFFLNHYHTLCNNGFFP